ncbi:MAG: EF-Tu/IF-2/RF-3 family GTPase, partial [Patescibacteria group bacterium]
VIVTNISYDNHKGRISTGKIVNGTLKTGQDVVHINREGVHKNEKITFIMLFDGLEKIEAQEASAGEIVNVAGISDITIGETIADPINPIALPPITIEEPTVKMTFGVNSSPFAGREGKFKTAQQLRPRIYKELENDVALKVEDDSKGGWIVSGRGELHLAILIERMRREGYEFQVSRPKVITKVVDGVKMAPYEWVSIEVPDEYSGTIIQKMGAKHAEMKDMSSNNGTTYLEFICATHELIGFRTEFLTDTKGMGIINSIFYQYQPDPGNYRERDRGSLVAFETGETRLYGLVNIQDRGNLFVGPGVQVYKGQVVGQNSRAEDISVNVCKEKKLSNMRSKGDGGAEHFNTPKVMSLEEAIDYIDDSELVEVTPISIRIRKAILDEIEARRLKKQGKDE